MNTAIVGRRTASGLARARVTLYAGILFLAALSCGEDAPTALVDRDLGTAGKPGIGDPTVTATDPSEAPQGVTLDVRVVGSNFDRGSRADMALNCEINCALSEKVKTNSTRYVSSGELVANITIAADATVDLYDVLVTTSKGKRGIGIELFAVKTGPVNPQTGYSQIAIGRLSGPTNCPARAISELDYVAGYCFHRTRGYEAFFWRSGSDMMSLGPGIAEDMSDGDFPTVVGHYYVQGPDNLIAAVWEPLSSASPVLLPDFPAGCPDPDFYPNVGGITGDGRTIAGGACIPVEVEPGVFVSRRFPVLWTGEGRSWSLPQTLSLPAGFKSGSAKGISSGGVILGVLSPASGPQQYAVWFPPYGIPELLPSFGYTGVLAFAVNDDGDVVGNATGSSPWNALYWKRNATGWDPPIDMGGWSPTGMNNLGTVVGFGDGVGWVWSASAGLISLAGQGVHDANDKGKLSGHDSPGRAVIWVPGP